MERRCTNQESCGLGDVRKFSFLDMPIADVLYRPERDWGLVISSINKRNRMAKHQVAVDWRTYNPNNFIFTHVSIVASVATDETGYRIVEPCDELVNANGNAWTNQVMPHCFRTFIGGENYYEHVQIPELSKGKILDAAMRPVKYVSASGKKADVYYVDLLVATSRKHEDLVPRILNGQLSTLSMGAIANITQCSYCGALADEWTPNCSHIDNNLKQYITDNSGQRWIVAELCGALKGGKYIDNSCQFIEASWVEKPAFSGAVVNYLIDTPQINDKIAQIEEKKTDELELLFQDRKILSSLRVADVNSMIALRVAMNELRRERYDGIVRSITDSYLEK